MILRYETWGAWVKLESNAAVVAIDRAGVRALGLDGADAWRDDAPPTAPIEVHLAVTARCGAGCEGCYLDARPDGAETPRETLERELDAMRDAGCSPWRSEAASRRHATTSTSSSRPHAPGESRLCSRRAVSV